MDLKRVTLTWCFCFVKNCQYHEFSSVLNRNPNPVTPIILRSWCCHHAISEILTLTDSISQVPKARLLFLLPTSWAAFFPWVLCTSHQLCPGGRFSAHCYPANLCLTKVPASSHSCLAGHVPITSEMTYCGPRATSLLINNTDAEPSSSENSAAPQQCRQGHHGDLVSRVTRGAAITQRQRQWEETSRREEKLASPHVCPIMIWQIFSGLNTSHRLFWAYQISMLLKKKYHSC